MREEEKMMANSLIVQSGGPTAVINSTVVGVVQAILNRNDRAQIYGALGGIEGMLKADFIRLNRLTPHELELLRYTPGAALGTCRYKLTPDDLQKIIHHLKEAHITDLYYIGGNGSMQVATLLKEEALNQGYALKVIGLPKTIDNDLFGTDHTPGFASTAKYLATMVLDLKMDVSSYVGGQRVTIVETMGRHTGWLAGACQLAFLEDDDFNECLIYLPEFRFDLSECLRKVERLLNSKKNVFLIVAEGVKDLQGSYLTSSHLKYDALNRPKLGGASTYLKEQIEARFKVNVRVIEPSIWQRSSVTLASQVDFLEAYEVGQQAVNFMHEGKTNVMVGMNRREETNYDIDYSCIPLSWIAGKEKTVPLTWYSPKRNKMTQQFIEYLLPLIQGEVRPKTKYGLPHYSSLYELRSEGEVVKCRLYNVQ